MVGSGRQRQGAPGEQRTRGLSGPRVDRSLLDKGGGTWEAPHGPASLCRLRTSAGFS